MSEIPQWMQRLMQQDLETEKEYGPSPRKMLSTNSRRFIWWLCLQYGVMLDGIMGPACSLFERYLSKKALVNLTPKSSEWQEIRNDIAKRSPLIASVCISLTSKMRTSVQQVNSHSIQFVLARYCSSFTLAQIHEEEFHVLSTLGFKVPLLTNVEKAEMMAHDVGIKLVSQLKAVALITQIAELYHPIIQERVVDIAFSMHNDNNMQRTDITIVRVVHLIAGAIAASRMFLKWFGPDPVPRLAFLTQCSESYIQCLSDVIVNLLVCEYVEYVNMCKPLSRKRRLVDD